MSPVSNRKGEILVVNYNMTGHMFGKTGTCYGKAWHRRGDGA